MALAAVLLSPGAAAAGIHEDFPQVIHASERYVIYSHGLIVEGEDSQPVHPEFGMYDFPAIKAALFSNGGYNLIAPHRAKNADGKAYVQKLEGGVRRLLAAGVPPDRITLVGFSRGAQLTAMAASRLRPLNINTALLALCSRGDFVATPPVTLTGRVLSVYETSDSVGSCAALARRSQLTSFEEIAIHTGLAHGAFYQPRFEWMAPLKAWIDRVTASPRGNLQ